jgi:acyl-CoA synthetase (AMP-forming)/AMP-acid ligase II
VREVSFAELKAEVEAAACYLARVGVGRGDRLALLLSGGVHFAVAFLAGVRLGAVVVPLNAKLTPSDLGRIVDHSGATWLIAEAALVSGLDSGDRLQQLHRVTVDPLSPPWLEQPATEASAGPPPAEDDLALLIYTSGTTGRPKGVRLTHANLVQSVMSYAHTLGLTSDDSTLIVVPLFYVTGLVAQLLLFLYLGGTTIIQPRFEPEAAVELLYRHRVTFFHAVATVFIKLTEAGVKSGLALEHLRLACCGGGPVTPAVIAALQRWLPQLDFRPVYGLTETSSPATISPQDALSRPDKPRSSGRPIPVVDCLVAEEDGTPVAPGVTGELLVRGAVVVDGYWNDPEMTARVYRPGPYPAWRWIHSGDYFRRDEEGFLYFVGRKST